MGILKFLLFPFALIYDWITRLRNHLYDSGYKHSIEFDRVVISVGNLNVGGSGKSPMIEYLIRLFDTKYQIATLSRGYGRKTHGYRMATEEDSARTIGDEPFQFYLKFKDKIAVAVGEERALAIPEILQTKEDTHIILLDDAFQHRPVKPTFSVLLTDYRKPFFNDFILPMGTLREARTGANRSDVVIVTKCDLNISKEEKNEITTSIQKYAPNKPVFFTSIRYGAPICFTEQIENNSKKVIAVSGIAQSEAFEKYVRSEFALAHHFDFPDHHTYSLEDLKTIHDKAKEFNQDISIITTEKDMVKLLAFKKDLIFPWYYIPIETVFIENGPEFDAMLLRTTKS